MSEKGSKALKEYFSNPVNAERIAAARKKQAESLKRRYQEDEELLKERREQLADADKVQDKETLREAIKRGWREHREERCAKLSAAWTPEQREAARQRMKERTASPDTRAKMSANTKAMWEDPEMRARMLDRKYDEEYRALRKELATKQWADSAFVLRRKKEISIAMKRRWEDPEYRRKTMEGRAKVKAEAKLKEEEEVKERLRMNVAAVFNQQSDGDVDGV